MLSSVYGQCGWLAWLLNIHRQRQRRCHWLNLPNVSTTLTLVNGEIQPVALASALALVVNIEQPS
jgi:hypothetical protein